MEQTLMTIKEKLKEPLESLNIVIDDISFGKEGNYHFLRIVLDRNGTLDLDSIVEATNIINPILDELDLIEESYILDVISKERG